MFLPFLTSKAKDTLSLWQTELEKFQIRSVTDISTTHISHWVIIVNFLKIVASMEENKSFIHSCETGLCFGKIFLWEF